MALDSLEPSLKAGQIFFTRSDATISTTGQNVVAVLSAKLPIRGYAPRYVYCYVLLLRNKYYYVINIT
jgi:hypothetical protein